VILLDDRRVNILTDIEVFEVSLVDKGANNKKIIYKSSSNEGLNMSRKSIKDEVPLSGVIANSDTPCNEKEEEEEKALEGEGTTGPEAIGVNENREATEKEDDEKDEDEEEDKDKDKKDASVTKSLRRKVSKAMIELEKTLQEKKELEKRLGEIEKAFREEREKRIRKEFIDLAKSQYVRLGNPEEVGLILKEASEKLSPETYGKLTEILTAANQRIDATLFTEIGKSGSAPGGSVVQRIEAIAKSYVASNPTMTLDRARAKAWEDNPELYAEYQAARRAGVV